MVGRRKTKKQGMVACRGGADGDMRDQVVGGLPRYDQSDARIKESAPGKGYRLL